MLLAAVALNVFYGWQVVNGGSLKQFFHDSDVNAKTGCDFYGLYKAGHALRHGKDIYDGDPQHKIVPCCYAFRYLPIGAAAASPLTFAKPQQAFWFWLALIELAALLAAWATYRHLRGTDGAVMAALWLASSPVYLELYMGQFNMLQAAFLLGALLSLSGGSRQAGEAWLGAGMLWKLTAWLGAPVLAVKRRWRTLLLIAATAVGTTLLYMLATGQSIDPFWENFRPARPGGAIYRGDLGFIMLLRVVVGKSLPAWLYYGVPVIALGACLALTLLARRAKAANLLVLWFAAYFFIYPTIWEHHYLLLLPPLVFLYGQGRYRVLWLAALLLALPTPYLVAGPQGAKWAGMWPALYHAVKPAAAAIVVATAAWHLWKKK